MTVNSKPEKHQQFRVLISVTVRVIIHHCPCTVCKRHLAFFFNFFVEERLILALGARLHLRARVCLGWERWQRKEPFTVNYLYLEDPV